MNRISVEETRVGGHSMIPISFSEVAVGDTIIVTDGQILPILVKVTQVKKHSIVGKHEEIPCRITKVSERELRFYLTTGPDREKVRRNVTLLRSPE